MANIQTVDYENIPKRAGEIREEGRNINKLMTKAYQDVQNMKQYWYGKRYNTLVNQFNNLVVDINRLLKLVVVDLPFMLETVANNYSLADTGNTVTKVTNANITNISKIPSSSEVGMKFISVNVNTTKSNVKKAFSDAVTEMNNIDSTFKKITWNSEAAEKFKEDFSKLKTNITTSFNNINQAFDKLVQDATNDIETAESRNTVS